MRKLLEMKDFIGRHGLAASLVASFAVVACSTNTHDAIQTNSPAPAVMRGASLTNTRPVNSAGPASMTTPSTEALAIAAENAGYNGRVLGYIEGAGPSPSGNYTPPTGQVIPPSLTANPQITVNSSISSAATPIITSGAGDTVVFSTAGGTTAAAVTAALTNTSANATAAAPVITTASTVATPTNTANILSAGQFAAGPDMVGTVASTPIVSSGPLPVASGNVLANRNGGALTPTVSSAAVASPTVASNPPVTLARTTTASRTTAVTATPSPGISVGTGSGNITINSNALSNASNGAITGTTVTNTNGSLRVTAGSQTSNARGTIAPINTTSALGANGMTSSSTITTNSNGEIVTASEADQLLARRRAVETPANGVTAPVTQPATGVARQRAVRTPANGITAPVSVTPSRQRAVRVSTAPDGSPVVTNTESPTFTQRVKQLQRDQSNPQH
jgi:hypothetical protein